MELRRAKVEDAAAIAASFRRVRDDCLAWLPTLHTPEEDVAFFHGQIDAQEVWLANVGGSSAGFAAAAPGWLNHLYVERLHHGTGLAERLLDAALPAAGSPVRLWCFQRNLRARRFYERRGFEVERLTDGSGNEEREPDVLYVRC